MTQKEKQLLLIDLCARLPYGIKVTDGLHTITLKVRIDTAPATLAQFMQSENLRYYLRPMSSMTEEEWKEFSVFIGRTERYIQQVCLDADSIANPVVGGFQCIYWGLFDKCIDWLNKNMFDYRGLIPMGLALEAKEGMYKTDK